MYDHEILAFYFVEDKNIKEYSISVPEALRKTVMQIEKEIFIRIRK